MNGLGGLLAVIGALILLLLIAALIKSVRDKCRPKTLLFFSSKREIWNDVECWAQEHGYIPKRQSYAERLYQNGSGLWTAASCLSVRKEGEMIRIAAWSMADLVVFKLEMATDEAYPAGKPARKIHAVRINKLLKTLGCPAEIMVG